MLDPLWNFLQEMWTLLLQFFQWMDTAATMIMAIEIEGSVIYKAIGLYRYIVGEPVFLVVTSAIYIAVILTAIKVVPTVAAKWKEISPFH